VIDIHSLKDEDIPPQSETETDNGADDVTDTTHSGLTVKSVDLLYL
jgi:hypothetical protein